jgi:hypothetical protein
VKPQGQQEQWQADLWSCKTVAAHLLYAPPPLAARGSTCRRQKNQASRGQSRLAPLFTFLPTVRIIITCNKRKMYKQLILIFFFSFSDLVLSPFHIHLIYVFSLPPVLDLMVVVRDR